MLRVCQGGLSGLLLAVAIAGCQGTPEQTTAPETSPEQAKPATETAPTTKTAKVPVKPFNPDFHEIQGNGVSLLLPPGYEGGSPQADIEQIAERLAGAGPEYDTLSQALRESKDNISLIAFDTQQATSGFVTNVNVASQELPKKLSAAEYVSVLAAKFQELDGYTVRQRGVEAIDDSEVGRLVVDIKAGELEIVQLFYAIPNEQNFWLVRYSTPKEEFEQRRRDFEQSILTFKPETVTRQPR